MSLDFLDFIQANSNDNNSTILIIISLQSWEFLTIGVVFVATEIIIFKIMISYPDIALNKEDERNYILYLFYFSASRTTFQIRILLKQNI